MEKSLLVRVKWSEHRERLKPFIDKVGIKANDPELYTSIDKACSNEWAFLFLAPDGFCVLQPRHQRKTSYIDVVIAFSHGGNAMQSYLPLIIKLAKQGTAEFIRFYTIRKGFEKIAPRFDWQKAGYHRNLAIWRYKL